MSGHCRIRNACVVVLAFVLGAPALGQSVWYVDDDAPPGGDGVYWETAFRFLQDGLAVAQAGDEVRVAEGVYRPDRVELYPDGTGDRLATFQLVNGVALRGGYAGVGAADPDERDIALYESVLSGDLAGDDGPDFLNYGENSAHVVTGSGTVAPTTLEGLVIRAGYAHHWSDGEIGAGLLISGGSPIVSECRFEANHADNGSAIGAVLSESVITGCAFAGNLAARGGALHLADSNIVVEDARFTGNRAEIDGGAIFFASGGLHVAGCAFEESRAEGRGGAVYCAGGSITIVGAAFTANESGAEGGGICVASDAVAGVTACRFVGNGAGYDGGGALRCTSSATHVTNCVFYNNSALGAGGAVQGGGSFGECEFVGNFSGADGGAFYAGDHTASVADSIFRGNLAGYSGGGMRGKGSLSGCTFESNEAHYSGGGAYLEEEGTISACRFVDNFAFASGGGLFLGEGATRLTGSEFSDNICGRNGGAVYLRWDGGEISASTFSGNFAADDGGAVYGEASFDGCTFADNWANYRGGAIYAPPGSNSVVVDAAFARNTADQGGGIHHDTCSAIVEGSTFEGHVADEGGGICNVTSDVVVSACAFRDQRSWLGAGIGSFESNVLVANSRFLASVGSYGAGMFNQEGSAVVTNCAFVGNQTGGHTEGGAAIYDWLSELTLSNSTITANDPGAGDPAVTHIVGPARITNCVFWQNGTSSLRIVSDDKTVSFCATQYPYAGIGHVRGDPLFVRDPNPGLDGRWGTDDDDFGDLRLQPVSPCIDAGCNYGVPADFADLDGDGDFDEITPLDLDYEGRFFDDPNTLDTGCGTAPLVDMGAYEFGGTGPAPCVGDLDGDRYVGLSDLAELLAGYAIDDRGDLDCDGDTDLSDLATLLANYRTACP